MIVAFLSLFYDALVCTWEDFHVTYNINVVSLNISSKLFLSLIYRALPVKGIQNSTSLFVFLCPFVVRFIIYIGFRVLWGRQSFKYSIYSVLLKYPEKQHIWYSNSRSNFFRFCRILIQREVVNLWKKKDMFSPKSLDYLNIAVYVQYLVDLYKKFMCFFVNIMIPSQTGC